MKAVILAGGSGTRLWPLSSGKKPKQFQKLISDQSLLEDTIDRLSFLDQKDIFIATNAEYLDEVKKNCKSVPHDQIISEPYCRDTAPCIGLAAMIIAEKFGPDEVMAIVYADHLVLNPELFVEKLKAAVKLSQEKDTLNIIEVKAKTPNTNLGYVKIGPELEKIDGHPVHEFLNFVEKPNLSKAEQMIADGNYLWNTGFYVWRSGRILEQFAKHAPEIYQELMAIKPALNTSAATEKIRQHYELCPKISIDYAIMEKTAPENVRILPAALQWSDIGTWEAIHEELSSSPEENITKGEVIAKNCHGSLIYAQNSKPIIAIGLENLIVVETADALLVTTKNQSALLKETVNELRKTHPDIT